MSDPSLPLQLALVNALKAAPAVEALVDSRVYDSVPTRTLPPFPYITLGELQVLPDKADCIDGTEVFPKIDAWSRKMGFSEVKAIAAAVNAVLDDHPEILSVEGFDVIVFEMQSIDYVRDPDGETHHAVLTFHALTQASS